MRKSLLSLFVLTLAACSNPPGKPGLQTPDSRSPSASDRYLPMSVGARWTYHSTDAASGVSAETDSVIEALEDVGGSKAGIQAYRVRSSTVTGSVLNWQEDANLEVVRQHEQFFDLSGLELSDYVFNPSRLRLDENPAHLVQGASWVEPHSAVVDDLINGVTSNANFSATWTIDAVDESVTVPAGTFSCLRVHRVQSGYSSSDETYWFARHIGKVKEVSSEPKELTSYLIP